MNRLVAELLRLFFPAATPDGADLHARLSAALEAGGGTPHGLDPRGADGKLRLLVLGVEGVGAWEAVAGLYALFEEALALPLPALAVSGAHGYRLWFALAEAVTPAEGAAFLAGLQRRYLAELPPAQVLLNPQGEDGEALVAVVPGVNPYNGKWSAFIDPGLGGLLADEPWLEMAPNPDKQADILAGVKPIKPAAFAAALAQLADDVSSGAAAAVGEAKAGGMQAFAAGQAFDDPRRFLLAVMNDPAVDMALRIEAARALL